LRGGGSGGALAVRGFMLEARALGRGLDGLGGVVVRDGADVGGVDVGGGVGAGGGAVGVGLGWGAGLEGVLVYGLLHRWIVGWREAGENGF